MKYQTCSVFKPFYFSNIFKITQQFLVPISLIKCMYLRYVPICRYIIRTLHFTHEIILIDYD